LRNRSPICNWPRRIHLQVGDYLYTASEAEHLLDSAVSRSDGFGLLARIAGAHLVASALILLAVAVELCVCKPGAAHTEVITLGSHGYTKGWHHQDWPIRYPGGWFAAGLLPLRIGLGRFRH
jgi:hypothetical protein